VTGDDQRGPAVRHDLRATQIRIGDRQWNERGPRPQTAQRSHHEVHRIGDQQGNPVAGLNPFMPQTGGQSSGRGAQFVAGQRAVEVLHRRQIGGLVGVVQHRVEHAAVGQAFGQGGHVGLSRPGRS
jgi:hypothetical protein